MLSSYIKIYRFHIILNFFNSNNYFDNFFVDMSSTYETIIVSYDGEWKEAQDSWNWIEKRERSKCILVKTNATYQDLVTEIYESIEIDPNIFDLELSYKLKVAFKMRPISIKNDKDVIIFLLEQNRNIEYRVPLCVMLVKKKKGSNDKVGGEAENVKVNNYDDDDNDNNNDDEDDGEDEVEEDDADDDSEEDVDSDDDSESDVNENEDHNNQVECNDDDAHLYTKHIIDTNNNALVDENLFQDTYFEDAYICSAPDEASAPGNNTNNEVVPSIQHNASQVSSTSISVGLFSCEDEFTVGEYFVDKNDLKMKLHKHALRLNFEFRVNKSTKTTFVAVCIDPKCKWRIRATKSSDTNFFIIRKHISDHTCSLEMRNNHHRQATSSVIGDCMKLRYQGVKQGPNPHEICNEMRIDYGVKCSYWKAWKARKYAQKLIRGCPKKSYATLPSYCYMLQKMNPGTITRLLVDAKDRFKYFFMAFGVSIRGFRYMRKVISIDGTHLKSEYKGHMLIATAQDGNFQIYPIAWGIVDSENNASWEWFLTNLRGQVPDTDDLVFVSDRHKSIESALAKIYERAHHGACKRHLGQNIITKFKCPGLLKLFEDTADAYRMSEFKTLFEELSQKNSCVAQYLENVKFERWSRAHFNGDRYNIMTTNNSESLNATFNAAREWPIIHLLETIRITISTWFHERRTEIENWSTPLTFHAEAMMRNNFMESSVMNVLPLNEFEFEVIGGTFVALVNLEKLSCTCREFDIDKIPCAHAIAAAKYEQIDVYSLCSEFYTTEFLKMAYGETIYPVPPESEWDVEEDTKKIVVEPPLKRKNSGRPKNKRIPSRGEFPQKKRERFVGEPSKMKGKNCETEMPKKKRKCSICGIYGHNKSSCQNRISSQAENVNV